jgi:hypothetical protein
MNIEYREKIAAEFKNCVLNTINRLNNAETYRPFHAALLSDEALFWSRFERSFSTSFGQRVIEEISDLVAVSGGATDTARQKVTTVDIDVAFDNAITIHIAALRDRHPMNWIDSINSIEAATPTGEIVSKRVISDLWWKKNGIDHYISIKTVKPNIDQTAIAKEDLLRLSIFNPSCKVYFGLYYNPYGEEKTAYNHQPPMGIFDFHHDEVVIIGKEYWDTIGGIGTYEVILEIAKEVGAETKKIISDLR